MKLNGDSGKLYAGDNVLICVYDSCDCDTIPWPLDTSFDYWTEETWNNALRRALFDARECGYIPDEPTVELPDGTVFTI